ncbi:MAG TPA: hypothetical protein VEI80_04580 [Candidatus Acidoferrales bacterium]|nr:hypothetical protein [Candidatus Acidoferrales bacterium]
MLIGLVSLSSGTAVALTGDFTLSLSSPSVSIPQGSSGTVSLYVTSLGDFAETVSMSFAGPPGVTAYFNGYGPDQIATSASSTTASTVTIYVDGSAFPGTYALTVTGTSPDGISNSAGLELIVTPSSTVVSAPYPDFLTQPNPAVLTLTPSTSQSTAIVLSSENGFSSSISLYGVWSGAAPYGVTVSLQSPVSLPAEGSATSILTLGASDAASTGTYTLAVTATNGDISHTTDVTVTIAGALSVLAPVETPDFSIGPLTTLPIPIVLTPDTSQSTTIELSSLGGFTSPVTLGAIWNGATPNDVTFNLSNPVTTIPAGGTASTTLTVSAGHSPSAGTYTIFVTATTTNGVTTHSTAIPITIEP